MNSTRQPRGQLHHYSDRQRFAGSYRAQAVARRWLKTCYKQLYNALRKRRVSVGKAALIFSELLDGSVDRERDMQESYPGLENFWREWEALEDLGIIGLQVDPCMHSFGDPGLLAVLAEPWQTCRQPVMQELIPEFPARDSYLKEFILSLDYDLTAALALESANWQIPSYLSEKEKIIWLMGQLFWFGHAAIIKMCTRHHRHLFWSDVLSACVERNLAPHFERVAGACAPLYWSSYDQRWLVRARSKDTIHALEFAAPVAGQANPPLNYRRHPVAAID